MSVTTIAGLTPGQRLVRTISAGLTVGLGLLAFAGTKDWMADWELRHYLVLASVIACKDENIASEKTEVVPASSVHHSCGLGERAVRYPAFAVTSMVCEGSDAVMRSTLSKVRRTRFVDGELSVTFGRPLGSNPRGPYSRAFVTFADQPPDAPTSRPRGIGEWGPWIVKDGCDTTQRTWWMTVAHEPWHGLWTLRTVVGPFELPAPERE